MINGTLFRREIKANGILFIIFLGIITMYSVMIVMMFEPEMGDSLRAMAESMPEIFAAFGMADVGTTLLEFISGYLYGMVLTIFPAVFILVLANRLVARYVSDGSMAYLLAAPVKRRSIVISQAVFLIAALLLMALYVVGMICAASAVLFPGELEVAEFIKVNAGVFGLWIFIGGICFLVSCIFNDSRRVAGINAGIVIYSYLIQMVSQVGDRFEGLKYITPFTLFNAKDLASGKTGAWVACAVLYGAGLIFIFSGIRIFNRRNLPL